MALFKRKPKSGQHFIVVFDLGSSSIGGAFASVDSGKVPEIIFATRRDIPFQEKLNFQRFLDSMIKTLEEMFVALQKAGGGVKVDQAYCVLASPWYASQTRLVHFNQPTPFVVTERGLDKLLAKEIELFRGSKLFARSKVGDAAPEIMESKNIQVKLNGYEVRSPFGMRVTELEVALYISMIPANIHAAINSSIRKFWNVPNVHFSSFSFTAFDTLRDIFADEHSFLFLDISGEVTDISIAKDNVLLESISFPAGKNMFLRALIKELGMSPEVALSEWRLFIEGKSTRDHGQAVENVLNDTAAQWLAFFEDSLVQFAAEFPIPRTIFYTADDDVLRWFEGVIKRVNFARLSSEDGSFVIRGLGNNFLSKFVQVIEPDFQDSFLAIETIFANKFISLSK
jgi:hypothetical protein